MPSRLDVGPQRSAMVRTSVVRRRKWVAGGLYKRFWNCLYLKRGKGQEGEVRAISRYPNRVTSYYYTSDYLS
jgi:hypothetical protein